ncbi:MAG: flagellar hook-basal body complex protein FliE, partial [Deltaproteobacteria bacterium]|nr:flagellar hook-basal body complex protein FliE [Deltaproteobacteria bacterium]
RVDGMDKEADKSIMDLLKGKADIHETMIALQKADISMRLLLAIRNKAIEAYKEITHMQF